MYPIAILWVLNPAWDEAWRWIRNSPTFVLFMPFIVPTACFLFVDTINWRKHRSVLQKHPGPALLILIGLSISALCFVAADFFRPPLPPFMRTWAGSPSEHPVHEEAAFRDALREQRSHEAPEQQAATRETARQWLVEKMPAFSDYADARRNASPAAWAVLIVNVAAGLFCAVIFGINALTLIYSSEISGPRRSVTFLVLALLTLFFPLRLYAEWYNNFYDIGSSDVARYPVFWVLFCIVFVSGVMLAVLWIKKANLEAVLTAALWVASGVAVVLAKFQKDLFSEIAAAIEEAPAVILIPFLFVLLCGLVAIGRFIAQLKD